MSVSNLENTCSSTIGAFQKKVQAGGYSINDRIFMNTYKSIQRFHKISDKIRWEDLDEREEASLEKAAEELYKLYEYLRSLYCVTPDCLPEINKMITNATRPLCNICRKFRI